VLLPDPEGPTIAVVLPYSNIRLTPLSISLFDLGYLNLISLNSIFP